MGNHPIYCSESFEWRICNNARFTHMLPANIALRNILRSTMHGYREFMEVRYDSATLLFNQDFNFDRAYIEGVLRYSRLVGRRVFPCGYDKWPVGELDFRPIADARIEGAIAKAAPGVLADRAR